jgi:hypothetical protein
MTSLRRLHLSNNAQRNAVIVATSATPDAGPEMGVNGKPVAFRRYISAAPATLDEDLTSTLGENYAQALIDGDPEINMEIVGKTVEGTQGVLLSHDGEPLFAAPKIVEITFAPDGSETERRDPVDVPSTVNDTIPVRWTGKKMPRNEVIRKYLFKRSMQLRHVDGVTYDFLFAMAQELASENAMVLLGAGANGKDPLILQVNGSPYRGFLEGRVSDSGYILLLHLSNMELKKPVAAVNEEPASDA